jgi:putative oxidoreductase
MNNQDFGKLILRLTIGGLMLFHGIDKLIHGVSGITGLLQQHGYPGFLAYGVYVGEIVAPIMILFGWRTRLGAVLYAVNMAVATMLVHSDDLNQLNQNGGWAVELQALFFFGAIAILFLGAGKFSFSNASKWD